VDRRIIISGELDDPRSFHHSHAVTVGHLIFVSGLVVRRNELGNVSGTSRWPDGTITHDGTRQFESIIESLEIILHDAESDLSKVMAEGS